jgi:hypothetical protein
MIFSFLDCGIGTRMSSKEINNEEVTMAKLATQPLVPASHPRSFSLLLESEPPDSIRTTPLPSVKGLVADYHRRWEEQVDIQEKSLGKRELVSEARLDQL